MVATATCWKTQKVTAKSRYYIKSRILQQKAANFVKKSWISSKISERNIEIIKKIAILCQFFFFHVKSGASFLKKRILQQSFSLKVRILFSLQLFKNNLLFKEIKYQIYDKKLTFTCCFCGKII